MKDPLFPIYQVDAFADEPFQGNPAGVCFMMGHKPDSWMQQVAKEMNLSETAFFMQKKNGYTLRWFTPETEVDLCGHATLATAHIIWETNLLGASETIRFETRSGILTASKEGPWIALDFPEDGPKEIPFDPKLALALGAEPIWTGQSGLYLFAELENEGAVKALEPDLVALKQLGSGCIVVTSIADAPEYDFISRFFGPGLGIDEDPVTGSAHCCLAPYWVNKFERNALIGYQASDRGGIVKVELKGDRVLLKGKAVTVLQGVFTE